MGWREDAKKRIAAMPDEAKEIKELAEQDLFFFARLVNPIFQIYLKLLCQFLSSFFIFFFLNFVIIFQRKLRINRDNLITQK